MRRRDYSALSTVRVQDEEKRKPARNSIGDPYVQQNEQVRTLETEFMSDPSICQICSIFARETQFLKSEGMLCRCLRTKSQPERVKRRTT